MSPRCTLAVAGRVLEQLRRDPRTIALVLVVPCVLMTLVKYIVRQPAGDLRADRPADARPVPADHDVPDHVHHDASRADHRDARAG